jgi:hypothetical protein
VQRKRVNIGVELVAAPRLLLADEPTSGLDASAAAALVATLRRVARAGGVTTAAVVHAPRHSAFALFDDLLLLGAGGRTAYYGPIAEAEAYFGSLGFQLPLHTNPADALLDIVAGAAPPGAAEGHEEGEPGKEGPPAEAQAQALARAWNLHVGCGGGDDGGSAAEGSEEEGEDGSDHEDGVVSAAEPLLGGGRGARRLGLLARARVSTTALARRAFGAPRLRLRRRDVDVDVAAAPLGGATAAAAAEARRRATPGFLPQLWWCLRRAALKRSREPLAVLTDLSIVAAAGVTLGLLSDRGRNTIAAFASQASYRRAPPPKLCVRTAAQACPRLHIMPCCCHDESRRPPSPARTPHTPRPPTPPTPHTPPHTHSPLWSSVIALGLLAVVSALPTFNAGSLAFHREAASGLNRAAYFCALDAFDAGGAAVRAAVYLATYASFASPRAVLWQQYMVSAAMYYACCGLGYLVALALGPNSASAQLAAAVFTLLSTLVARQPAAGGVLRALQSLSFARWALEGMVVAESNRLVGVWLLARCATLRALHYDVRRLWTCVGALAALGAGARAAALALLMRRHGGGQ